MTRRLIATAIVALLGAGCGEDGDGSAWDITLSVSSSGDLGALQLDIVAPDAGEWMGKGARVDCEALVNAVFAANFAGQSGLKLGLISLEGLAIPGPIVRCGFESRTTPEPGDFTIRVIDAADSESDPVSPLPIVAVSDIRLR